MRIQRWLACVAAALGLGQAGCQTWVGGMTLPSPRYLEHYPQYFPPDGPFPLPRELATMTDPDGTARGGGAAVNPALVPPAAPVPAGPVGGGGGAGPGVPPAGGGGGANPPRN